MLLLLLCMYCTLSVHFSCPTKMRVSVVYTRSVLFRRDPRNAFASSLPIIVVAAGLNRGRSVSPDRAGTGRYCTAMCSWSCLSICSARWMESSGLGWLAGRRGGPTSSPPDHFLETPPLSSSVLLSTIKPNLVFLFIRLLETHTVRYVGALILVLRYISDANRAPKLSNPPGKQEVGRDSPTAYSCKMRYTGV